MTQKTNIVIFCGGRGSSTLIREMSLNLNVELTLLINAFDDGLSTGALRRYITNFLGPSDFRKNISLLLSVYRPQNPKLKDLFEYRFTGEPFRENKITRFKDLCFVDPNLDTISKSLPTKTMVMLSDLIDEFFKFEYNNQNRYPLLDTAIGNLIFAGAFLQNNQDFNVGIKFLLNKLDIPANVLNISQSTNRHLVALTSTGRFLEDESTIVSSQNHESISEVFLLESPLEIEECLELESKTIDERHRFLTSKESIPCLSDEARLSLGSADLIILGAGTQHSSLLPSYKIVSNSTRFFPDKPTYMVMNLDYDNDIYDLTISDIVELSEQYLFKKSRTIDKVFIDLGCTIPDVGELKNQEQFCVSDLRSSSNNNVHSGKKLFNAIFKEFRHGSESDVKVLVAGQDGQGIQLFRDNCHDLNAANGMNLNFELIESSLNLWDSDVLLRYIQDWLENGVEQYLVTVYDDGIYDAADIEDALRHTIKNKYDLTIGSRLLSRDQWVRSSRLVYNSSKFKIRLSNLGGLFPSLLLALLRNCFITDCFSGFRIYSREGLASAMLSENQWNKFRTIDQLFIHLVRLPCSVGEVSISYLPFESNWKRRGSIKRLIQFIWEIL